jgi:hypothetical protein
MTTGKDPHASYFKASYSSPALQGALFLCAALTTHWVRSNYRYELRTGYDLWAGSFFLLAAGLATSDS